MATAIRDGARIVDVRPVDEFAREHLASAVFVGFNRRTLGRTLRACVPPGPLVLVAPDDAVARIAATLIAEVEGYRVVASLTQPAAAIRDLGLATGSLELMSMEELAERLARGDQPTLLDVREPFEWRLGFIEGSTLLSLPKLRPEAARWTAGGEVVCICEEGVRSVSAACVLKNSGVRPVKSLDGGIAKWFRAGLPLTEA